MERIKDKLLEKKIIVDVRFIIIPFLYVLSYSVTFKQLSKLNETQLEKSHTKKELWVVFIISHQQSELSIILMTLFCIHIKNWPQSAPIE